ncbi:MAG TPA: hypothetical protein VGJ59_07425 [Jatrophihabitantaceae bacterium]|jgi:hypothetical protein
MGGTSHPQGQHRPATSPIWRPSVLARIPPSLSSRQRHLPTGSSQVITGSSRRWCLLQTADGCKPGCLRVHEGGEVLQWTETDHACFAGMLGSQDGTTLSLLIAD